MKALLPAVLAALIAAGCGIDAASTAATGAALKKQEVDQAKQSLQHFQKDLDRAQEQMAERAAVAERQQ